MNKIYFFFRKKKFSNIGIFIVTFLTVLLATVFISSYQNVLRFENKVTTESNIEDFSFYPNLSNVDSSSENTISQTIDNLANKYNFSWEDHKYAIYNDNNILYRIYDSERKFDNFLIIEGSKNRTSEEVMIDYLFAKEHNISVGNSVTLKNKTYTISAIVIFSDMINPIVDNSGKLYDKANQALIAVQYDQLSNFGTINHSYVGKFNSSVNSDVTKEMQTSLDFYSFTKSSDNTSIFGALSSQKNINLVILSFSISILSSMVLLLIFISISESIKEDYKHLGVLKALGYTNIEISRQYLNYFIIVTIPACLGYIIGKIAVYPFFTTLYSAFSIPFLEVSYFDNIWYLVFIPAILMTIFAFIYSIVKVKNPALDMIKGSNHLKGNIIIRKINNLNKERNFLKQTRKILLFSRISIIFFVAFSGFAFTVQSLFAYTTYIIPNNIERAVVSEYGYEKNVRFIEDRNDNSYNTSLKFYSRTGILLTGDENVEMQLVELGNDNLSLLKLRNSTGSDINIKKANGIVINKWMSVKFNLNKGDNISISVNGKEYKLRIGEVTQNIYGTTMYMSEEYAEQFWPTKEGSFVYNGIFTNDSIDFNGEEHLSIISKDEITKTLSQANRVYLIFSIMLLLCGLIIGVTILTLSLNGVVNNYKKYISFMKLIGYTDKECDYLVINSYRFVILFGYLLALPYTFILCKVMFNMLTKSSNIAYLINIDIVSMTSCLLFVMLVTELTLNYFKFKLKRVSFREILES